MNARKIMFPIMLLILCLVSGCGSFEKEKEKLLVVKKEKDLTNSFDLNKEQTEFFKEKEPTLESEKKESKIEGAAENKAEPKVAAIKVEKKKRTKKVKNSKKAPDVQNVVVKSKEKPKEKPQEKIVESFTYPSDYPQILKDYDSKSEAVWAQFKPSFFQGEQSIMAISYLGVTAGYITILLKDLVKINDRMTYHYYARFKTKEAYSYFYWLDDYIETFVDKETFLPTKYALIQREKKQNVDDLQLFDFKKLKTYHWYKRVKEGKNANDKIENYIPRFAQDSFSALQFVRGLPMVKGNHYDFPAVTRGKPWLLKVEVIGEESISVNDQNVQAYKLTAETHFPGVLEKSGDINFWYAADETRRLLKFQAKVKIGSIYGELVEYKAGVLLK